MTKRTQAAAVRRADAITRALAIELRQLREDCGLSQRALGSLAGVPQSVISRVESSLEVPSIETYARLATGLGGDLSIRVYPNTGPTVRDRHQARIGEAPVRFSASRWRPFPEVGVRRPVRGWIDLVLADTRSPVVVAAEIESLLRRLEQVIRWSNAKSDALPSASAYPFGSSPDPAIHRLLVIRDTARNRAIGAQFQATLKSAYRPIRGLPWPRWPAKPLGRARPCSGRVTSRWEGSSCARLRVRSEDDRHDCNSRSAPPQA